MLGALIRAVVGVPTQFLGVALDIINRLAGKDGGDWYEKLRLLLREGVGVAKEVVRDATSPHLLRGAEALSLRASDGTRTLAQAKDVFMFYIDPDFIHLGLDVPGVSTPTTCAQVYELLRDGGTFRQIFTSLSSDLDKLVMSQHQIITFCQEHRGWLRHYGSATFFVFKECGELFVAFVNVRSAGLSVGVDRFEEGSAFDAAGRGRLVVPQR